MAKITEEKFYDGSKHKIERLALWPLIKELKKAITSFQLEIKKEVHGNGSAALREMIDNALREVGDWTNSASGDVDWIKCRIVRKVRACVGVEVQVSARSDLIFRDIVHFQTQLREGQIDVCVEILPSDALAPYLVDRTPRFSDAVRIIDEMRADDLPIILIAIEHDRFVGAPLGKRLTNQGQIKR